MIYRPAKYVAKELRKGKLYRQSAVVHVSSEKHKEIYDRSVTRNSRQVQ